MGNGMKIWKGNGNTKTLLFSLKRLEIVHQERRGQVKTIVMEHFNDILFNKSGPANKQHTNQPTNQPTNQSIAFTVIKTISSATVRVENWRLLRSFAMSACVTSTILKLDYVWNGLHLAL